MYSSETEKIRDRVLKYCKGVCLDIGPGHDKIKPDAIGIDMRQLPGVDKVTTKLDDITGLLPELVGKCDAAYSSHCLEHFRDDWNALTDWIQMLRIGGYGVWHLPCDLKYDNKANKDHVQAYTREAFDDYGEDRYSFVVVMKRSRRGIHAGRFSDKSKDEAVQERVEPEQKNVSGAASRGWLIGHGG